MVFSDKGFAKGEFIIVDDGIQPAVIEMFLEQFFLVFRDLIIFVKLVLLLQERQALILEVAIVCKNVEDEDI